jgi:hypothetical protein
MTKIKINTESGLYNLFSFFIKHMDHRANYDIKNIKKTKTNTNAVIGKKCNKFKAGWFCF